MFSLLRMISWFILNYGILSCSYIHYEKIYDIKNIYNLRKYKCASNRVQWNQELENSISTSLVKLYKYLRYFIIIDIQLLKI
jgi:hypothetical protein